MNEFFYAQRASDEARRSWWRVMRAPVGSNPAVAGVVEIDFLPSGRLAVVLARLRNLNSSETAAA